MMYNCVAVEIKKTETAYVALSDGLCFFVFLGGLGSWVRRERHMSAPAGALWDAPAGNAREGEEGVGESPHVVGVVKSMAKTQK